ncbi:GNAT family N-acetyltransferase [Ruegeria halocynthiae]|nr:GNAT family N-acetyltransferase [Ruegeria halocynthiae]
MLQIENRARKTKGIFMLRTSNRSEADSLLSGLALGFSADPFMRWLYPEPGDFLTNFPRVMDFFGGRAFEHDSAFRNDDFTAGALWLPPRIHPDEEQLVACFEQTVAPEKHDALFETFEQMDKYHPDEDCWHLAFIAVDPYRQGKGLGSTLLESCLRRCDEDGRPAYLESTNPANLPMYKRFGFQELGLIKADQAPPLFPMFRAAQ